MQGSFWWVLEQFKCIYIVARKGSDLEVIGTQPAFKKGIWSSAEVPLHIFWRMKNANQKSTTTDM